MQLCALDTDGELIFASHAEKQQVYRCMECGCSVRMRKGLHRQPHYYHTHPNRGCRQHGKGMAHLYLQRLLKDRIATTDVEIECRFPSIGRIADVAWLSKQLIFEIQYSPISAAEVNQRNADYASIGYRVIWIFFDGRYNQRSLTAAEDALSHSPHYFTNVNIHGEGIIYDQFSLIESGMRIRSLPRTEVNLAFPYDLDEHVASAQNLPKPIKQRTMHWGGYFSGDNCDICLKLLDHRDLFQEEFERAIDQLMELYKDISRTSIHHVVVKTFQSFIMTPYRALFRIILERACR